MNNTTVLTFMIVVALWSLSLLNAIADSRYILHFKDKTC